MEELILVDEVTQSVMKHNPQKINSSYKTATAAKLDKSELDETWYIRPYSGNKAGHNITIAEYVASKGDTFAQYIVSSGLYKNVYFEANNFDEQYWNEYKRIFRRFVTKLGEGSIADVLDTKKEREEFIKKNDKNGSVVVKGSIQKENSHTKEISSESYQSIQSFHSKCSKEAIKKWIAEERINVDSLPTHLCEMIKEFLDSGQLHIIYKEDEKFTQIDKIRKIKNLKVDVRVPFFKRWPPFFRKKKFDPFEHIRGHIKDLQQELKKKELKKEVFIYAHFKHDGVI